MGCMKCGHGGGKEGIQQGGDGPKAQHAEVSFCMLCINICHINLMQSGPKYDI